MDGWYHPARRFSDDEGAAGASEAASRLPDRKQGEFAAVILEQLDVDARGEAAFARSHDAVERLADEA